VTSDFLIKILSVVNSSVFDFSDSTFTIGCSINIISPNGGEEWLVGKDYLITWTDNITENVEIHLYKNGIFYSVIQDSEPSDGSKAWSIPPDHETGSDFTIRISSVDNSNIHDFSDNVFSLTHNIEVNAPNGGENWQIGSDQTIIWSDNLITNVRIELHKADVLESIISNSEESDGAYIWNINPDLEAASDYKVKILSVIDENVFDFSDNDFTLSLGEINITEPNGGELWKAGTTYQIHWSSNITSNVKLELYKGGMFNSLVVFSTGNDGTYIWTDMPFTQEGGSNYQVKITSVINSNAFDFSDSNFTIIENKITVLTPNGGEVWVIGEFHFITWDDNLNGNVAIYLFKGDQLVLIIDSSDPSDGSFLWTIPSNIQPGFDYKIKIASRDNGNIYDLSDDEFTITDASVVEELYSGIPNTYQLIQNYPNPFNPRTTIYYALPEAGEAELIIYDILGNAVMKFVKNQAAGYHKFEFDGNDFDSGVYFYRLKAGDPSVGSGQGFVQTKKMILIK
jgi:hypothetical protein